MAASHRDSHTYSELRRMAESVGWWIREHGYTPGSRIAILADNHPRWTATYLGIIAAGCTAVPLDTAFHPDQVTKLLEDSGSAALFTDSKQLALAQEATARSHVELVLSDSSRRRRALHT